MLIVVALDQQSPRQALTLILGQGHRLANLDMVLRRRSDLVRLQLRCLWLVPLYPMQRNITGQFGELLIDRSKRVNTVLTVRRREHL